MTGPLKVSRQPAAKLTDEQLKNEILYRKCFPTGLVLKAEGMTQAECDLALDAFQMFCENFIQIKVSGGHVFMELRDAQLATARDIIENRRVIILKARQIGFSTLIAAFALWCVLAGADRQVYLLSKGQREARSLLSKARYAYRKLPEWVKTRPATPKLTDRTLERMTFDNDSFIISAPSAQDPIRGETAWLAVVDEWAMLPDQEAAWASIEPTADLGGRIIGLSTAKGEGDFFHDRWLGAGGTWVDRDGQEWPTGSGSNGFKAIFHGWWAVPARDDAWYKRKLDEEKAWFVAQEYPASPEEAFIGSGNPFFNLDLVRKMVVREPIFRADVTMIAGEPRIIEKSDGETLFWDVPQPKTAYVIGADVAYGLEHGDYSVCYVMEAKTKKIVAMYRGHCSPGYYAEHILRGLGYHFKEALICPEVNNHGHWVVEKLNELVYPNIYRRRSQLLRRETIYETLGFMTNRATKPPLVDAIHDWMVEGGEAYDPATIHEFKTFVRETRGDKVALHGSPHDDCVMALGMTIEACRFAVENNLAEPKLDTHGSIQWHIDRLEGKHGGRRRLGPVFS